jgi:deoxyribodipyrimidine photolyase-related protein
MDIFIIFPVHLFSDINLLNNKKIYLVEEPRFFTDFLYHKLKIAYHHATMKSYADYLKDNNLQVTYINFNENIIELYKDLSKYTIHIYDPTDNILLIKIKKYIPNVIIHKTLNFLIDREIIDDNLHTFYNKKTKKYNHLNFYKMQRTRLNILTGYKWSYDKFNRKKIPLDVKIPSIMTFNNTYIDDAKIYVEKYFKNNYGSLSNFIYPINHQETKKWFLNFLKNKFENFGIYQDAETDKDPFLFHSVLSPMMNIGLITDKEVLDITLLYQDKICIESFEGFIRQIIGWRNYMYTIYLLEGNNLVNVNIFNSKNKLNKDVMWNSKTDILPIDNVIKKINDFSYAHHIERLMYLSNYMLICMVNPKDVYTIFMEWTIDAYDWVMVPNVYGMSSGEIMTRPYLSSSNYILKMSNYKKDKWCIIMDALYYNFINIHKKYLSKNYATSRQVAFWNKKSISEKNKIIKIANDYLNLIFVVVE